VHLPQRAVPHAQRGKAVRVDPIIPKLKPPGTKRLKENCDVLLSTSAFIFNLRRYNVVLYQIFGVPFDRGIKMHKMAGRQGLTLIHVRAQLEQLQDTFMS